jgi:hypothetical protein
MNGKRSKKMQTIKTSELTGSALDWAVAKCEEVLDSIDLERINGVWAVFAPEYECMFEPSTCWTQGGPIIEREHISIEATRIGGLGDRWMATDSGFCTEFADKPLIAAMRCYVSSKLGDTVEIPKELL